MSFDRLAPHYRWLERVLAGRTLQRARLAHLETWGRASRILLAGEGPGRLLESVCGHSPGSEITVVDVSSRMLAAATTVAQRTGVPVEFIEADLREWSPAAGRFETIVTSCVLDCFAPPELEAVIVRLARAAAPRAWWADIDFTIPAAGWRRARARLLHPLMYATFRRATGITATAVTAPDPWLTRAGFVRRSRVTFCGGLIRSDLWERGGGSPGARP